MRFYDKANFVRIKLSAAFVLLVIPVLLFSSCANNGANNSDLPSVKLSIDCTNALESGLLSEEMTALLPEDGVILSCDAEFSEGESVADILLRETKNAGILTEVTFTPMYGSIYVEGIANLYEFDCGELSGWMYRVNGEFPNYGCSGYYPEDGDVVEWVYTCDLGKDVGSTDFS